MLVKQVLITAIAILISVAQVAAQNSPVDFKEKNSAEKSSATVTVKLRILGMHNDDDIKLLTLYMESKPGVTQFLVNEEMIDGFYYECNATITSEVSAEQISGYAKEKGFAISARSFVFDQGVDLERILMEEKQLWSY
ncbi:MAG: hypothetical protein KKA07_11835 [Bacteroidetes bacterium]|nr:hypothetical protein [Bacteroidota bacterium]MBU1719748.1 hypothetical protein [Bacteroidota bacterium]